MQQEAVACCTLYKEQVSSEVEASHLHPRGLAKGESWRLGLRSSRMQSMPVDTAPRKTRAPSAEITTKSHRYHQCETVAR